MSTFFDMGSRLQYTPVDSVVDTALSLAKEGTHAAIAAVVDCARQQDDWRSAIGPLREAMRPFDGAADDFHNRGNGSDDWNPSRTHSIEEVPLALGFLVVTGGDYEQSIFGGTNYGRDCDSIAGMAGSIAGALHGAGALRSEWIDQVNRANRVDMSDLARDLTSLVISLHQQRMAAAERVDGALAKLQQ